MRYSLLLFIMLLSCVFSANAQKGWHVPKRERAEKTPKEPKVRVEFGNAIGLADIHLVDRGVNDNKIVTNGTAGFFTFDFYARNDTRFSFMWGVRMGGDPFGVVSIPVTIGLGYNSAPKSDIAFRASVLTGPMILGPPLPPNVEFNAGTELNAGVFFNQFLGIGLKYVYPWYQNSTFDYYGYYDSYSTYRYQYLMLDIKLRVGRKAG